MDFRSVNPLNVQLNLLSGNLLPMTSENSFPIFWKIYSLLVWLLEIVETCMLIPGCMFVPREMVLRDGLVALIIIMEVVIVIALMYTRTGLVQKIIMKLDDILHVDDEIMRNIVTSTLKPMEIPLKFYWLAGVMSIVIWSITPFLLTLQKKSFSYVDYRMPVAFGIEPLSTGVFISGNLFVVINNVYIFTKKVSIDSYIIHIILLITAQYKYIALKFSMIFQDEVSQRDHGSYNNTEHSYETGVCVEKKIITLCRHHNAVLHMTIMLSKLVSLIFSLIYVISVLRFCGIAIMVISIPSVSRLEGSMLIMYACGGIVQLYIMCSCVQQLLDASIEITDQAFHEEWYRYGKSIKQNFMLMIMANNLKLKLSTFERYNLSLSSYMVILNQSYSVALLLSKTQ